MMKWNTWKPLPRILRGRHASSNETQAVGQKTTAAIILITIALGVKGVWNEIVILFITFLGDDVFPR